jgi:GxxExxY protein
MNHNGKYTAGSRSFVDQVSYEVIGAAIEVQRQMGRGLFENVYHECMKVELAKRKLKYFTELTIPAFYDEKRLRVKFRCDLFVEDCLVVELKSVKILVKAFEAKLLNYMKLLKAPKGILINFECSNIFREGQRTFVNEYYRALK